MSIDWQKLKEKKNQIFVKKKIQHTLFAQQKIKRMGWSGIVSVTLLIAFNFNVAAGNQDIPVNKLCPYSPLQGAFNQITNNRPFVRLFNGTESAALVHQVWTEDNLKSFQDCAFTVDANLYFDSSDPENSRFGRGLTFSVRRINFRYDSKTNQCIDYVRFTFAGSKTEKICGTFDDHSQIGQGTYFLDPIGIIKVHIFVDKSKPLEASQRTLEIDLAFTSYEHCTGKNLIRCHTSDDHFCISDTLKNDGIHNCMWPSDADEPNRKFPVYSSGGQQQQTQHGNSNQKPNANDAPHMHAKHSAFYFITLVILIISTMI